MWFSLEETARLVGMNKPALWAAIDRENVSLSIDFEHGKKARLNENDVFACAIAKALTDIGVNQNRAKDVIAMCGDITRVLNSGFRAVSFDRDGTMKIIRGYESDSFLTLHTANVDYALRLIRLDILAELSYQKMRKVWDEKSEMALIKTA